MWNIPTQECLSKMPGLHETESIPVQQKLIHLHFFLGESDWYAVEFDGEDVFFGFVILYNDYQNAEWGYFSFFELKEICLLGYLEIDCEIDWHIKQACHVDKICRAKGWLQHA